MYNVFLRGDFSSMCLSNLGLYMLGRSELCKNNCTQSVIIPGIFMPILYPKSIRYFPQKIGDPLRASFSTAN